MLKHHAPLIDSTDASSPTTVHKLTTESDPQYPNLDHDRFEPVKWQI